MPALQTSNKKTFATNKQYQAAASTWKKCRDAIKGEQAIKAGGKKYLPAGEAMDKAEYADYLNRAVFYAAAGRTQQGLTGMLLRKPPTIEYPDEDDLETIGAHDETLLTMIKDTTDEVLAVGRVGFLVDAANSGDAGGPAPDTKPYVAQYAAENIINWHSERIDGRFKLTLVVLQENRESSPDAYGNITTEQIFRVLRFGNAPAVDATNPDQPVLVEPFAMSDFENGFYFQEVWVPERDTEGKATGDVVMESRVVPRKTAGRLWTEIPFAFLNAENVTPDVGEPPLNALIDVNLGHWRNSGDLEHGLHFVALPTPYAFGEKATEPMRIGSATAWNSENPDMKVGMLEFSGKGLAAIETAMAKKEGLMAILGARLLEDQKAGVETAEALKIRLAGDGSVMTSISILTSRTWTTLLTWVQEWVVTTEVTNVSVELSLDFTPKRLEAPQIAALGGAVVQGLMSYPTYWYNLQQGELTAPGWTIEEEMLAIQAGVPGGVEGFATPGFESANDAPDDGDDDNDGNAPDPDKQAADNAERGV